MANDEETNATRRAALSPLLTFDEFRPLSSLVRVELGARSHRGATRQHNDDHYLVVRMGRSQETLVTSLDPLEMPPRFDEWGYAMLVADGLGEGGAGSVASRVALSTLAHLGLLHGKWNMRIDAATAADIFDRMEWYYNRADAAVLEKSHQNPLLAGMAAALTASYSVGDDLFVAHVGHTRAYLFRDGLLTQLTRDHTIERHLTDTGRPASIERRAQDLGHILTDAVGARGDHPLVEVERFQLVNGDGVLLCTNGLTDVIGDEQIADVLTHRRRADDQCAILADLAAEKGSADNITVVLAFYQIPRIAPEK